METKCCWCWWLYILRPCMHAFIDWIAARTVYVCAHVRLLSRFKGAQSLQSYNSSFFPFHFSFLANLSHNPYSFVAALTSSLIGEMFPVLRFALPLRILSLSLACSTEKKARNLLPCSPFLLLLPLPRLWFMINDHLFWWVNSEQGRKRASCMCV